MEGRTLVKMDSIIHVIPSRFLLLLPSLSTAIRTLERSKKSRSVARKWRCSGWDVLCSPSKPWCPFSNFGSAAHGILCFVSQLFHNSTLQLLWFVGRCGQVIYVYISPWGLVAVVTFLCYCKINLLIKICSHILSSYMTTAVRMSSPFHRSSIMYSGNRCCWHVDQQQKMTSCLPKTSYEHIFRRTNEMYVSHRVRSFCNNYPLKFSGEKHARG